MGDSREAGVARRAIAVSGVVQGVGFRPFVHGLASRHALGGFVKNRASDVLIEVEGDPRALDRFAAELRDRPPPLARIEDVTCETRAPRGEAVFRIEVSDVVVGARTMSRVSPDVAACDACVREILDPYDRRHGHAFANCTSCGPRLTIVRGAPYDRERTTMAAFAMCEGCRAEYDDPLDRRFHAQPIACPRCGPKLTLRDARGAAVDAPDPIARFARALVEGAIGALKGIGGYHLACDARSERAVAELRRRKVRDEKPFAIMIVDTARAAVFCEVSDAERALLESPARPIVLLRRRDTDTVGAQISVNVAPRDHRLGVMLPYTPLHHLLLRAVDGAPLVMTSANAADEPIAFEDDDATTRLAAVADLFLSHDRAIETRCDDSIVQAIDGAPAIIRRSRGYAPEPLAVPSSLAMPTLAVGAQLKSTFALGDVARAFVSQHIGDLDHPSALRAYVDAIESYERLFAIAPRRIVRDLHPDYASSRYAEDRAERDGLRVIAVQHHHAHFASCLAEHCEARAIGVVFDGAGLGTDGALWGGEIFVGDRRDVARAAHLAYVPLPGGERAMREPWRMAIAHLVVAGADDDDLTARVGEERVRVVRAMIERGVNAPSTSSVGRLFDAIASIAGVCDHASYEGQAAMRLESLAARHGVEAAYPFELSSGEPFTIDVRLLVREASRDAIRGVSAAAISARFHAALAAIVSASCARVRERSGISTVALTGGCFMNAVLASATRARLEAAGFRVLVQRRVPTNDGGISYGQLAVCAARDAGGE